jgi:acyl-coenzyme A thioesterase PaaI-like protein
MALPFKHDLVGSLRIPALHGGVAATFIDHCSGLCAWSVLRDPHQTVSTIDLRVDYLSPA